MMHRVLMATALALAIGHGSAGAATILVDTFDSENGGAGALNYGSFANFGVSDGTVDLIPLATGLYDFLPGNGLYVDLDGSTNNAGVLTSNAFTLGAGSYELSFDMAGSRRSGSALDTVTISVFGSGGPYASLVLSMPYTSVFASYAIPFAVAGPDDIRFSFSNAGADNQGALLDNVRLSSVPEPATVMLLGLGACGVAVRRKLTAARVFTS